MNIFEFCQLFVGRDYIFNCQMSTTNSDGEVERFTLLINDVDLLERFSAYVVDEVEVLSPITLKIIASDYTPKF